MLCLDFSFRVWVRIRFKIKLLFQYCQRKALELGFV